MKDLTIIMPYLNEGNEPVLTIESIMQTAPSDRIEIIAINDKSSKNILKLEKFPNVIHINNKSRMGVDACRQMGLEMASSPNVLIIDAHMRFKNDDWFNKMLSLLQENEKTIWCTICLQMGYGVNKLEDCRGRYYGADILFATNKSVPERVFEDILEPKWRNPDHDCTEYEIPCVLGANYFMRRDWALKLHGFKGLQMWGSSEPFLSLKSWLAGGNCKITRRIQIGHKFRKAAPYVTKISPMIYNKLYLCKTILPGDLSEKIINMFQKNSNFNNALRTIEDNLEEIQRERAYYQGIFTKTIYELAPKLNIHLP